MCSARLPSTGRVGIDNQFCSTAMFLSLPGSQSSVTSRLCAGGHRSDAVKAHIVLLSNAPSVIFESAFLLAQVYANETGSG